MEANEKLNGENVQKEKKKSCIGSLHRKWIVWGEVVSLTKRKRFNDVSFVQLFLVVTRRDANKSIITLIRDVYTY